MVDRQYCYLQSLTQPQPTDRVLYSRSSRVTLLSLSTRSNCILVYLYYTVHQQASQPSNKMFHSQGQMANPLGLMSLKRGRDDEATESCQIGFTEHRNVSNFPIRSIYLGSFVFNTNYILSKHIATRTVGTAGFLVVGFNLHVLTVIVPPTEALSDPSTTHCLATKLRPRYHLLISRIFSRQATQLRVRKWQCVSRKLLRSAGSLRSAATGTGPA